MNHSLATASGANAFHSWRVGSCVYRCRICAADSADKSNGEFANSLQFWRHVKDGHGMASPATYLAAFPGNPGPCVLRRSFACGECGVDVAHDLGKMTMHMLKKHAGMDLREYYDKHIAAEEKVMVVGSNTALTVNEPSSPGVKNSVSQSEADNTATTSPVPELEPAIKTPEGFTVVPEEESNDAAEVQEAESTDSDDAKPLIRLRRGRKRKRNRKDVEKKFDRPPHHHGIFFPAVEEDSDSEPIISDEEERNFTYQSLRKRACNEAAAQEDKSFDTFDDPGVELANVPKESPVKSPELKTDQETVILPGTGETIFKPQQLHWAIGCAFRCLTCDMVGWGRLKMRNHMLGAHKMGWDGKTERYEKIYHSVFTCQICNEEFPHELDRVHQHMKGKHNIAPKIYYNKFLIGKEKIPPSEKSLGKGKLKRISRNSKECPICKKTFKRPGGKRNALARHMEDVHNGKAKDNVDSGNDSMSFSGSESNMSGANESGLSTSIAGDVGDKPKNKVVKRTVPETLPPPLLDQKSEWYDGCAFACAVCSASAPSKETVRSHCAKVHHDAGKFAAVSTASYKCKICLAEVIHEKEALKAHFMDEHSMRLASYYNSYEDAEREARSREKEEKRRLSKEKHTKKMEAEAARSEAERKHKGPKCPMGMCRELLESVEEAAAHVGEVHGIGEDDVMTRKSVMNKIELQLKWRRIIAS